VARRCPADVGCLPRPRKVTRSAMRIIVVTNRFGDLGTHPQLTRVALHLKAAGHEVRAISLAPPGTIVAMFAEAGIETDVVDASRRGSFLLVVGQLAMMFRRRRPHAVVAFLYETILPARLAANLSRVPVVISSIRNEYFGPRYRELLLRATASLSATTVVNSQRVADSLLRRGVARPEHLVVIPNGIDTSRFRHSRESRESIRQSLGLANDEFAWLAIGRLAGQKAYPHLFKAFSHVIEDVPRSKLLVVGRGPLGAELESLVRRSGLRASVSFLGFRSDVPSLLAAADALVTASRYEGMPNVVMEALASERPVVGTNVGGMSELIRDGVNGYLVPPSDPQALASAMTQLALSSTQERLEMGTRGRALVEALCDLDLVMGSWTRLIEDSVRGVTRR
jgi:glycosyltransferase involved in cell wall biosynthesis